MAKKKSKSAEHYNAILLESIRSDVKAGLEKLDSVEGSLITKINGVEERIGQRLDNVELAITMHSREIKELKVAVKGNTKAIEGLDQKVNKIGSSMDRVELKVEEHEKMLKAV